jgi:hypothetical protein
MSNLAETLYYNIYSSMLLGENINAKMYLSFLREEYYSNEHLFEPLKKDNRWEHLIELGNAIDNNLFLSNNKNFESSIEEHVQVKKDEIVYSKQDDLVKAIILSQDKLRICLKAESDFHCIFTEMETKFGRVDLVAQDKNTIYPIEVKKNGAYHDVLGQINKYIIHFKLKLINRIYNDVVGVVIANSFDNYVLKELYKFNIFAIKYKFISSKEVEFKKI